MTRQALLAKQQECTARFDELQKQADQKRTEIESIEDELKRLQGEYRLIESFLLEEDKPADPAVVEVKEAKRGRK